MTAPNVQELDELSKLDNYWCEAYTKIPMYGTIKCTLKANHQNKHHWYYLKTHEWDDSQVTLRGKGCQ